jgi:integrase/recombinase XerD
MSKVYLEPIEIEKLEAASRYLRDRLLIRLLFHLGCRISEALGITVDDIDFNQGTVTIQHLKIRAKLSCPNCKARLSKANKFCSKCGIEVDQAITQEKEHRRFRRIPLDKTSLSMLKNFVEHNGPVTKNNKSNLFGINRHRAWQIIKECSEKAGLPKLLNPETGKIHNISPHKLRDAFAVMAVKNNDTGDGIRMLQEHLGHQSITTTMRYRKVSGEEQRDWYNKLWGNKDGN